MAATNVAALAIAGVIFLGFVALVYRAGRRIKQADAQVERILSETLPAPARPVRDTVPGINLADQDACELLLDDPEFAARCDRLWDAIREQQKGDTA